MRKLVAAASLLALLWVAPARADDAPQFDWQRGPGAGEIAGKATIDLAEDFVFLDAAETARYVEWSENIPAGDEYLFGPANDNWEAYFAFSPDGYVRDDEQLDPDELLATLRRNQAASNEERRQRGWPELAIEGWQVPPRYNEATRTLEWATRLVASNDGHVTVNYNTRVLGRKGTMSVQLVARPENFDAGLAEFNAHMDGFAYNAGQRYADYRSGDRVAEYGLAALVTGGAVAAAGKKGLFKVIGVFLASTWKLLLAGLAGIGLWLGKSFRSKKDHE